ncbi:Glycoside hydrolase, family 3 [Metarhizium guizhouense ARSEF 977]|uniref:Beta-glucosidase cel3A n=1 Tax=Metarhizium guizhouense (strain ARSEF 977) TaxID=1276136 RepID=A0A0B4GQH4_METGA|nr:Glycoside hydrolase, family 3 [Metarhizium guizhouense ARSEF 977]
MIRVAYLVSHGLVITLAQGQVFNIPPRSEGAFTYVQPENITILGGYGHSPAVLPSPTATGSDAWGAAFARAKAFVAKLTLEEKADMVTGQFGPCVGNIVAIPRLGFHGLCLQDGPMTIRQADYVSVFSAGVTAASSWDRHILYERGFAMGQEFRAKGAHIALSPVAGPLGRSAYSGRNWEGFAADPYLTGVAMELTIKGHQDAGVQATPKHFIGNEQETQRYPSLSPNLTATDVVQEAISSNIDDRTMHELYLWPFANAVRAGAASVMCSYQRVNGSYACQNSKAINGLLKGELGFQGYVMSDWGATHSGASSIQSGLDMDMPGGIGPYGSRPDLGSFFGGNLTQAVRNSTIQESRVDDMIVRIMTPYYWLGQDRDFPTVDPSSADLNMFSPRSTWLREFNLTGPSSRDVRANHGKLIRRHAAEATILLKNKKNALPLKAPKSIAVFGNDAGEVLTGPFNMVDYEFGTLAAGGGSGTGRFSYLISPLAAITARAKRDNALVQHWQDNTLISTSNVTTLWNPNPPDVCLVFLKTWATEGIDRETLGFGYNGSKVVESVARFCNNTIVISHSSGINDIPFASHPNVTAILAAHYPGQESGNSIVDVLYGDVNPSGRLPYTIARNGSDYNAPITTAVLTSGKDDWQSWFTEKLEIDYRYFDAKNISVLYEFGFGLSYTTFNISNIKAAPLVQCISPAAKALPIQPGGNPALWEEIYSVTVDVTNSGPVAGAAVPQLYVTFPDTAPAGTPPKQLRGFDKVFLAPRESRAVRFALMRRDMSYWDVVSQQWLIPHGEFVINVGFSSRDIIKTTTITPTQDSPAVGIGRYME